MPIIKIAESFGEILTWSYEGYYQGDSWFLLRDNSAGRYSFLSELGSCNGCDAWYAYRNDYEEIDKLIHDLQDSVIWFNPAKDALDWFKNRDWETLHVWYIDSCRKFVAKASRLLKKLIHNKEKDKQ